MQRQRLATDGMRSRLERIRDLYQQRGGSLFSSVCVAQPLSKLITIELVRWTRSRRSLLVASMKRSSGVILSITLLAGCAAQREQPAPAFPPVPESTVRVLQQVPQIPSKQVGTVTIQQDSSLPIERSYSVVRKIAAEMGADAIFFKSQTKYNFRNGDFRPMKTRIITFTAVRIKE